MVVFKYGIDISGRRVAENQYRVDGFVSDVFLVLSTLNPMGGYRRILSFNLKNVSDYLRSTRKPLGLRIAKLLTSHSWFKQHLRILYMKGKIPVLVIITKLIENHSVHFHIDHILHLPRDS